MRHTSAQPCNENNQAMDTDLPAQRRLKHYVQRPDRRIEEKGIVDEKKAMDEIRHFPAEQLLSDYLARKAHEDVAPPCLGFEDEQGALLELIAMDRDSFSVRFEEPCEKRFLGFKFMAWKSVDAPSPPGEAAEAAWLFIRGHKAELMRRLKEKTG